MKQGGVIKIKNIKKKKKMKVIPDRLTCFCVCPGCDLPSMPWDLEQVGSAPREKSFSHHLFLW